MKVSVITACFNAALTIEDTVASVISQSYPDVEYIIVDGGSTDGTLGVVARYRARISTVISEKDKGIYDALNKGIAAATGEVVAILHSDDCFAHPAVLADVVAVFERDLECVKRDDPSVVVRRWIAGPYVHGMFLRGWMPPHPSFFARRDCYRRCGSFDTTFRSSGDYELMLRFLHVHRLSVAYLPGILVRMRLGGMSNVSLKNRIRANTEDRRAWAVNGLRPGLMTLIRKPLSKLHQYRVVPDRR